MVQETQTYISGFNAGFKLNRFTPDLFEKLKDSLDESKDYDRGILDGAKEWEREKEKQRMTELDQLKDQNQPEQEIERE